MQFFLKSIYLRFMYDSFNQNSLANSKNTSISSLSPKYYMAYVNIDSSAFKTVITSAASHLLGILLFWLWE